MRCHGVVTVSELARSSPERWAVVEGPWVDEPSGSLWILRDRDESLLTLDRAGWHVVALPDPPKGYFSRGDALAGFRGVSDASGFRLVGGFAWKRKTGNSGWAQESAPPLPQYGGIEGIAFSGPDEVVIARLGTSQTDPNYTSSNPLQITWAYDAFARKSQENRPDGTYTKWVYNDCASTGGCLIGSHGLAVAQTVYNSDGTTETDGTTYLDSVDRTLVSNKRMLASGTYDRNEVRYDNLGRVAQQAAPCVWSGIGTACTYWTTNNYDILNRITQTQRPISASNSTLQTTIFGYAGRTSTVKDALGNTTAKITLVTGKPARTVDPKGYYENFSYDAFGSLKSVTDSASNSLFSANYAYGINAFQTSSSDMDLGARSYTIDALGEVTAYSDAKGQSFSQTYDALSRPLVRTDNVSAPDLTTTWTWGTSAGSYNIGRLQTVTAAGSNGTYAESYSFDSLTRPQTKTISVPSDASYTYISTYNAVTGLLDTLSYPTSTAGYSLKLQYGYANGILQQVKDANSSTVFWQNTGMNARGQVTQETLGNGIVTNRAYDAVTGWVASIESGVNGGAGVQNQAYVFDYLGNVTQRQDNNLGLTENFYYDADYRLDHSVLNGTLNLQMTYDGGNPGPGNITARSDVAGGSTWTYDSVRKHAVTQAGTGGYAFTYDANGNAATRNGYNITWSSYNYPISINGQNKNVTLYYGPNRQYYEQVYSDGSSIEQTIYAGRLLEKVTLGSLVDWRHYIRVNNELVAIMSRQSTGTNVTHYALSDHQGSLAEITDGSGATTVTEDFNAFGARRNPATWSGMPTCPDLCAIKAITREGYTGHDAIGGVSLGLNHMNGRVEDAITGRFLSPDPQGINFGNTQSFNRYSYVGNNPLSYTDPTGFTRSPKCIDYCGGSYAGPFAAGFGSGGGGSLDGLQGTDSTGDFAGPNDDLAALTASLNATSAAIGNALASVSDALDDAISSQLQDVINGQAKTSGGGSTGGTSSSGSVGQSSGSAQNLQELTPIVVTSKSNSALNEDYFTSLANHSYNNAASSNGNQLRGSQPLGGQPVSAATWYYHGTVAGASLGATGGTAWGVYVGAAEAAEFVAQGGAPYVAPLVFADAAANLGFLGGAVGVSTGGLAAIGTYAVYNMYKVPTPPSGWSYQYPYYFSPF